MDILKLKQDLKDELADILERSQFVEKQKQAREAAVDRLTRAEAIAIAATLHELLGWLPSVKVETSKQSAATAVSVSASVTGDDVISYRRRYEFALTGAGLRSKVLLDGEQINLLSQPQ